MRNIPVYILDGESFTDAEALERDSSIIRDQLQDSPLRALRLSHILTNTLGIRVLIPRTF